MNTSALYHDYLVKSGEPNKDVIKLWSSGLIYIIGHYFLSWSSDLALIVCCRNSHTCTFYNDMLSEVFAAWEEWPVKIFAADNTKNRIERAMPQYNVILTDSYYSFRKIGIDTNAENHNKNEYYFIYLRTPKHLAYAEMQKIFKYCWQNSLINCVIQIQRRDGKVLVFTYFPFTEKFCGHVEAVVVNEYNGSSFKDEKLFPKKLKNLYGCPLRVSVSHVPPYIYLSKDAHNGVYVSGGFEGKLLLEIAKKLNFSLNLVVPPNDAKAVRVINNNSLIGPLKMLKDRKADISLGAIRQTSENVLLLTSTIDHYQSTWIILVLNEAYILTSLESLMFPFSSSTWYLLTSIGLFAWMAIGLLQFKLPKNLLKRPDYVILDILLIALGLPAFCKPIFNTTRILKATWIMFSLILRTIYGALLFHLIRAHVLRNMPETVRELVSQNYSLIVDQHTFEGLKGIAIFKTINFIVMHTDNRQLPLEYLEKLPISEASRMAVALPVMRFQYYIQTNKKSKFFKVLSQKIMNVKLCMYLPKHSYLVEQLNDVLMMIQDFGITGALVKEYIDEEYAKKNNLKENLIFGLKQLKMVFVILLIGHFVASVAFMLELLYRRIERHGGVTRLKWLQFTKKI